MGALDELTYRNRELFEYWGHAACLLPISLYPLLRYRMREEETKDHMRSAAGAYLAQVYAEVAERGPLAVSGLSDPGKRMSKWWGWGKGKEALEQLYWSGLVAISGRRGFERLYDIAERVIPKSALTAPVPPREEAMKQMICLAARACGMGTFGDITSYFHTDQWADRLMWWNRGGGGRAKPIGKRLVSELVEAGRLREARVDGWGESVYIHPGAKIPRSIDARAIVTPFDSLVWERSRIERLFGMKYTIEIYTPPPKRIYGYYVCPFLLGDTLVARVDLKADRQRKVLMVQSAHLEPGQVARRVAPELADELKQMQAWLELESIEVAPRGDLTAALKLQLRKNPAIHKKR